MNIKTLCDKSDSDDMYTLKLNLKINYIVHQAENT